LELDSRGSICDRVKFKVKVTFTLEQAMKAQRRSRDIALIFFEPRRYMGGVCLMPRSGNFNPEKEPRYPLYRRLGGHQDGFGWVHSLKLPKVEIE
jgi:hypothetical protein